MHVFHFFGFLSIHNWVNFVSFLVCTLNDLIFLEVSFEHNTHNSGKPILPILDTFSFQFSNAVSKFHIWCLAVVPLSENVIRILRFFPGYDSWFMNYVQLLTGSPSQYFYMNCNLGRDIARLVKESVSIPVLVNGRGVPFRGRHFLFQLPILMKSPSCTIYPMVNNTEPSSFFEIYYASEVWAHSLSKKNYPLFTSYLFTHS